MTADVRLADGTGTWEDSPVGLRAGSLIAVAGSTYALIVLIMWATFNLHAGFPFETSFPYMSETNSIGGGFLYIADPLRIHTNTFYHLSYLAGEALGVGGSYVPYQVVFAILWWARGFLVFLLLRRFFPRSPIVWYTAGVLVIVHASDRALQWVGQMNQPGFIFWMLLAFWILTVALDRRRWPLCLALTCAACAFEYMSLWSYESQLLLMLVFPIALLAYRPDLWRRLVVMSVFWYAVPAVYIRLTLQKYAASGGATYQESVMRRNWNVGAILGDWWFNIAQSLEFWHWPDEAGRAAPTRIVLLSALVAALVVVGGMAIARISRRGQAFESLMPTDAAWGALFSAGFVLLALSFPVYLMLDVSRSLWRTQFLSGIGCGLVLAASIGFISDRFRNPAAKLTAAMGATAAIAFFGSTVALERGSVQLSMWELHRSAMTQILRVAPSVKPGTMVVLIDVPKSADPFQHNMWLDMGLRLAYLGTRVGGIYVFDDHTPSPGSNIVAEGGEWKWDGSGFPPELRETSLAKTVIVKFEASGHGELVRVFPSFLCRSTCNTELYDPVARITGPVLPRTVRRYQLNAQFQHLKDAG